MNPAHVLLIVYWIVLTIATALAGAYLIFQGLRPRPFGRDGLGVHSTEGALLGGVGFLHRWSMVDRLVLVGWGLVLESIGGTALAAAVVLFGLAA